MATQKASDKAVKDFAQRLVDDHSKANQELENIAKSKSISMPAMRHSTPANISNATGADFDRAYINQMIANHQKGVANFERMSTQAQDAQLRDFVTRTLPTLREHLSQAQSLKK
jgi:putative membrane protein